MDVIVALAKRVLVVDDNADMVNVITALLALHGYECKAAPNAIDIVACIRDFDPHAVIMDIAMPGKSGWDAAKEVRANIPGPRPLLVAVTGERTMGPHKLGPHGFDYFLSKPCDVNVLLALVGQAK
jgi:CheY-like chemotaxis protein